MGPLVLCLWSPLRWWKSITHTSLTFVFGAVMLSPESPWTLCFSPFSTAVLSARQSKNWFIINTYNQMIYSHLKHCDALWQIIICLNCKKNQSFWGSSVSVKRYHVTIFPFMCMLSWIQVQSQLPLLNLNLDFKDLNNYSGFISFRL